MTLTNSGLIEGRTSGITSSTTLSTSVLNVINSGTITAPVTAISCTAGSDRITNSGTINGTVELGAGADTYNGLGGTLNGIVFGGLGADTCYTDLSRIDIRETGTDIDTVFADCSFRLTSLFENLNLLGTGNHRGFGSADNNLITGNSGDNRLSGLEGNDNILGEFGDDTVQGGDGLDTIEGGDGDDNLTGGLGKELMFGNTGADRFIFATLSHIGATTSTADIISDFTRGDDVIDLRAIDANVMTPGTNDTFTFLGTAAFGNVAGQARVAQSGGNTFVELDANGDSVADAMIRLNGLYLLNVNNFAL